MCVSKSSGMSHFSALLGYDVKELGIKAPFSHYSVRAIIVVDEDLYYESQTSLLAVGITQGVVEVNFQLFKPNPVLLLQLSLYETFETQLYQREFRCYHAEQQLELINDPQNISFRRGKEEIFTQCAVTGIEFDAMTCMPLIELDLLDFRMPRSGLPFSAHYAVEVQTDTFKFTKYMGCREADLSGVVMPFEQEFLLKVVYVMEIYGTQHVITLANARIQNSQALIKGAIFEITDIDCKFSASVFALIDALTEMVGNAIDEARDEEGNKIKLSSMVNPQFLERFVLHNNPKLVSVNLPKFQIHPPVVDADDKKLEKLIDEEIIMCEDLARQQAREYERFELKGSVFIVIQTFPAAQKTQEQAFRDLEKGQKSIALAAVKINRRATDFGFALISNKEIELAKAIQQFEVGTGNLAYCNPTDTKQFLQLVHRTNYSQVVKLLVNNGKSLIQAAKAGLTLYTVAYEQSLPFTTNCTKFTQDQLENGVRNVFAYLENKISTNARLRVYIQDLLFCEKNGIQAPEAPEESVLNDIEDNASMEEQSAFRASFNTRASFVSRVYNQKSYDPARYVDYFGAKIKTTQFCVCNRYVKTLREFIADAEEQARILAEEEAKEAEEKRIEEEKRKAEEEERQLEERLEQERIENERLEAERLRLEQEELERQEKERIAEEKRLEEQERQRQIEQLKFMQMRKKYGGCEPKKTCRKMGADERRRPRVEEVQLDCDLINLRCEHTKKEEGRNEKLAEAVKSSKARLRELELQFEKETLDMQYEIEYAHIQHEQLALAADNASESDDADFEEELALELFRAKERLEKEQESRMLLMDAQYAEQIKQDQVLMLERRQRATKRAEEQERQRAELEQRARRRQQEEERKYAEFIGSRKMYRLGQPENTKTNHF